jgi:hypothetical protein
MEASSSSSSGIVLPQGVTIGAGRETSETNAQGQVVQGMRFPITTAGGSTTAVFIPYSEIHDTAKVQAAITKRVAAITAISG